MNSIYSYSLEELTKIMLAMGQSAYRGKQNHAKHGRKQLSCQADFLMAL